jgi:hypothetical protein
MKRINFIHKKQRIVKIPYFIKVQFSGYRTSKLLCCLHVYISLSTFWAINRYSEKNWN